MLFDKLAEIYNIIYTNKNYEKEVDFLDRVLKEYNIKSILDIGCGIGTRSILLNSKGYKVVGIDRSSNMVKIATMVEPTIDFRCVDILDFKTEEKFDCCLILFNVLGYIKDISRVFTIIRKILKKDGILILDYWDSDLLYRSTIKKVKLNFYFSKYNFFIRFVQSKINNSNLCVNYNILKLPQFKLFSEIHHIRLFKKEMLIKESIKNSFELMNEFQISDIAKMLVLKLL